MKMFKHYRFLFPQYTFFRSLSRKWCQKCGPWAAAARHILMLYRIPLAFCLLRILLALYPLFHMNQMGSLSFMCIILYHVLNNMLHYLFSCMVNSYYIQLNEVNQLGILCFIPIACTQVKKREKPLNIFLIYLCQLLHTSLRFQVSM